MNNPQSLTTTNASNVFQIPVHNITQTPINDQNRNDTTHDTNQDNTSTLSTSITHKAQQFQTQQTLPRNYDPPPLPSQLATQTTSHNSPQQGSSNTQTTNTVQFQTTTPTTQPIVQTLAYTPAQNTQTQNIQTTLTTNTLHSNAIPNYTTSRTLSRPPLQTIPTNPLSYSLTSTNPNYIQHSTTYKNKNQLNTLKPFSTSQPSKITRNMLQNTQFQTSNPPSTTI